MTPQQREYCTALKIFGWGMTVSALIIGVCQPGDTWIFLS